MSIKICDLENELCTSIQNDLNMLLNEYKIQIKTSDKGTELLTHSGSSSMGG